MEKTFLKANLETYEMGAVEKTFRPTGNDVFVIISQILGEIKIFLFLPNADSETDYANIIISIFGVKEIPDSVQFYRYQMDKLVFLLSKDIKSIWPTGIASLFRILIAIDEYMRKESGFNIGFTDWVVSSISNLIETAPFPAPSL